MCITSINTLSTPSTAAASSSSSPWSALAYKQIQWHSNIHQHIEELPIRNNIFEIFQITINRQRLEGNENKLRGGGEIVILFQKGNSSCYLLAFFLGFNAVFSAYK